MLPFPERVRKWALSVTDGRCITPIYDEAQGWHICGEPATDVDHLEPESVVLYEYGDPNNESTPIPRCKKHHTGVGMAFDEDEIHLASFGEADWSRHPDMGAALEAYREGDKDAFMKAARKHIKKYKEGDRFWNEDEGSERYERELFDRMAQEHGEPRPDVRPHKNARKKRHWASGLFD